MTRRSARRHLLVGWLAALAWGLTTPASAQTNERLYEDLDFRFVTPGARAIGMGKTFVGLADDATAAATNPAGLSNLLEPELSFEFSGTQFNHRRVVATGPTTIRTFGDFVVLPSFGSVVFPAGRATVSGFFNSAQRYKESFAFDPRQVSAARAEDGSFGFVDASVWNLGGSAAYVAAPWLSVGGSLVATRLRLDSEGNSGSVDNRRNGSSTHDVAWGWSGFAGVLAKPIRGVAVGVAYYGGASMHLDTELSGIFGRGRDEDRDGREDVVPYPPADGRRRIEYVLPAKYSVGASWHATDALTLLADASRVLYSQRITPDFLIVDFMEYRNHNLSPRNYSIPDVTEYHVGAEYRVRRRDSVVSLRGGLFTDPDHQMRFDPILGVSPDGRFRRDLFEHQDFRFNSTPSDTDIGYTAGAGVLLGNRLQVDLAAAYSRDAWEIVFSIVNRFL